MEDFGVFVDPENVDPGSWIKIGLPALFTLAAKDVFDWTEEDIYELGRFEAKISFIIKVFLRHFVSKQKILSEAPKYWNRHFDFGELEIVELNEEKGYVIARTKGFAVSPLSCIIHKGYFHGISEYMVRGDMVKVEETKCVHEGDEYNEFIIKWN